MAFRLKTASCVTIGTFNTYIVQPAWLTQVGILPAGEMAIHAKFDEPGLMFSSPKMSTKWIVQPNKIAIETDNPAENCGELMARILAELRWTPLIAMGNNALYEADLEELKSLPDFSNYPPALAPSGFTQKERGVHTSLAQEESTFNIQLTVTEKEVRISANVHTDLRGHDSEFAQAAARKFLKNRTDSEFLIREILKGRVEHAPGNDQL